MRTPAVAVIVVLALLCPGLARAKKNLTGIKVFVTTAGQDQSGFTDPDMKQRADSVKDLNKSLSKDLQRVDSADQADVVITVLGRGDETTGGSTTRGIFGGSHTDPDTGAVLRVSLTVGDYKTSLEGVGDTGRFWPWTQAAEDVSGKIERWISENHDKLVARRK